MNVVSLRNDHRPVSATRDHFQSGENNNTSTYIYIYIYIYIYLFIYL